LVAVIVTLNVPVSVGVPEMVAVEVANDNPAGKLEVTAKFVVVAVVVVAVMV